MELGNVSTPVKVGAGTVAVGGIGGAAWFFNWVFAVVLLGLLLLFIGGWLLYRAWARRRQNARLSGQLQQHSGAAPKSVRDPGRLAQLDDLRQRFQKGVNEYRSRGKDLYKLPWYVICGPPGAGKTEAIRHCNVGFPPGMQDYLQGTGGTINMNWWFTNNAVILDTAGKMMFEEVSPGETSEWREFLRLLKKTRPGCPINGLFLAISIEDLIKDSADKILQKAGKIAQQLDIIQRELDVRFPVYVIVTKCDLLTGFREFFDDITDPQLQHQIMGWSNPDPLDTSFRAELIDQHLGTVSQRLRRRRLGQLRDPVPEDAGKRRTDEVDALFALPHSLSLIGPRLRRYLETIFVAGEWSAKPLFLRGIYFTSSMREGSALDQELAEAIGVGVAELPSGKSWERERAFFLRDLFLEKVFKERGLVTRATNTAKLLWRRRALLYGTGFGLVAIFIVLAWFGRNSLKESIGRQASFWQAARQGWQEGDRYVLPIVGGGKDLSGKPVAVDNRATTRAAFHASIRDVLKSNINFGIFRPLAALTDVREKGPKAARVVFDRGVVAPIVDGARRKMATLTPEDSADPAAFERESGAIMALVDIEAQVHRRGEAGGKGSALTEKDAARLLTPLLSFLLDTDHPQLDTNVVRTMSWLYSQGPAQNDWPAPWMSGGATLSSNAALKVGLEHFLNSAQSTVVAKQAGAKELTALQAVFKPFHAAETALLAAMSGTGDVAAALKKYQEAAAAWDAKVAAAKQTVLQGSPFSAEEAYKKAVEKSRAALSGTLQQLDGALASKAGAGSPLFRQMKAQLDQQKGEIEKQLETGSPQELAALQLMDRWALTNLGGQHAWQVRAGAYQSATATPVIAGVIGERWASFSAWQTNIARLQLQLAGQASMGAETTRAISNYLERTTESVARQTLQQYFQNSKRELLDRMGYPLVRDAGLGAGTRVLTAPDILSARDFLDKVINDLVAPQFAQVVRSKADGIKDFTNTIGVLRGISYALLGTNSTAASCNVTVLDSGDWRNWLTHYFDARQGRKHEVRGAMNLGAMGVSDSFDLKLYRSDSDDNAKPTRRIEYGTWAPIRMIETGDLQAEGLKRTVSLKVDDLTINGQTAPGGTMQVQLDFPSSLPALRNWPTRQDLEKLVLQ